MLLLMHFGIECNLLCAPSGFWWCFCPLGLVSLPAVACVLPSRLCLGSRAGVISSAALSHFRLPTETPFPLLGPACGYGMPVRRRQG